MGWGWINVSLQCPVYKHLLSWREGIWWVKLAWNLTIIQLQHNQDSTWCYQVKRVWHKSQSPVTQLMDWVHNEFWTILRTLVMTPEYSYNAQVHQIYISRSTKTYISCADFSCSPHSHLYINTSQFLLRWKSGSFCSDFNERHCLFIAHYEIGCC